MVYYKLKLFINGQSKTNEKLFKLVGEIAEKLSDQYDLEVVDIRKCPDLAVEEKILVTPTLVRYEPQPPKRIVGDLTLAEEAVREIMVI